MNAADVSGGDRSNPWDPSLSSASALASGYFSYDDATQTIASWNVHVPTASFLPAFTYLPSNSSMSVSQSAGAVAPTLVLSAAIVEASGPPGSITPVHTHPGSEAFYVLAGETSSRSPHGVLRIGAGQAGAGHGADMPMRVSSSGSTGLLAGDVRGGRRQAVFIAGQIPVTQMMLLPAARTRCAALCAACAFAPSR